MSDHFYLSREVPVVTKPVPVVKPRCTCSPTRYRNDCVNARMDGIGFGRIVPICRCICHTLREVSR